MARTKAKKITSNHAPPVPVPEHGLTAKEPSTERDGRSPPPDPLLLTQPGPNLSSVTTAVQSKQSPGPIAELSRVHEEPEHEEAIIRSQEPPYSYSAPTIKGEPCPRDTSSPRPDLQTTNAEPEETSLALLHSLKNETSRRVQPARYRPVGASDATTEGVDSSIIEAAEKARTVKPIIPPGTKFLLYNGPAKEGEKEVKWELSAGQRAGYYSEKNGEGNEDDMPVTECWKIEGWDALAEGKDDDVADGQGHAPVVTNRATPDSSANVPPNPNIIGGFDFSDATYINRHKKYTVVEKRHRLREQEMVQWELSKLPAKISQLRALDVSVFKGKTLEEKEQYRADMLDAAETLEKRFTAHKNVVTARKENRPIDPAGHMNYLTSWHQPTAPHPVADEGDAEAGITLPSTKKRKRYELEDQDAGFSALDWDEDEEFVTGIGSRAPVDHAYAPGHYPSNRKKVRKEDRKKAYALNGDAPVPEKSKTKSKKKMPPPKVAVPPASTLADGSSVAPTDLAFSPSRPPPIAKTHAHVSAKPKLPPPALKKPEMCALAIVAKRLAEGRREGRDGGTPFGAPFPAGGFVLPYAGSHGAFQLPTSLALQAATESAGNIEVGSTEKGVEEIAPQDMESEPLVAEAEASENIGGTVEAQQVQGPPHQHEVVVSATPANVLEDYDDEPLTELSSDDGQAEPDDQDEQDERHSTPADEDADGEGEEEGEDTGEEETVAGMEVEDEDTDSFQPGKSTRR